jgi:3'(2'), 5'-bisphosphate nucleotidase
MLSHILTTARSAGQAILTHYGKEIPIDHKADDSPLTQADLAAHHLILDALTALYPEIPVVSEEGELPDPATLGNRFWLVDPLDGTKEFIQKRGSFTVNIALIENGVPVLGVVHAPAMGETYWAAEGEGAWHSKDGSEPVAIKASAPAGPLRIVASRDHAGPEVTALLARFPDASCLSIGSSLKFCLIAAGEADAYLRDVPTMEWDTAAAHAIIRAAGATLLNWPSLEPLAYGKTGWRNASILTASSPDLAAKLRPATER